VLFPAASWDQAEAHSAVHGWFVPMSEKRIARVRKPGVFSYTPPCVVYTPQERKRFLEIADLFWRLACCTGCRLPEFITLDLAGGRLGKLSHHLKFLRTFICGESVQHVLPNLFNRLGNIARAVL